jgi:hypothetical protein
MKFKYLAISLILTLGLITGFAPVPVYSEHELGYEPVPYTKPPRINQKIWNELQPYLLPVEHPIKPYLDAFFMKERLTAKKDAFKNAGFIVHERPRRAMNVLKHPLLSGYVLKTYLDDHNTRNQDWALWKRRIDGANYIRRLIEKHQYTHLLSVPHKWLYPLPPEPKPVPGRDRYPQSFLLVAEDMNIYDGPKNQDKYLTKMNYDLLNALFTIITEGRLIDSVHLSNIPFTKDGRISFIDTEYYDTDQRKIHYSRVTPFLSPEMQEHWRIMVRTAKKK